jgi:hypothetical protein
MNEGGHEDDINYPIKETNDMGNLEAIDGASGRGVHDVTVDDAIVYLWATGRERYRPAIQELRHLASMDLFEWARNFGARSETVARPPDHGCDVAGRGASPQGVERRRR